MAFIIHSLSLILPFVFLLFASPALSATSPHFSPSPSPHVQPEIISPSPSPAPPHSPPSPPPSDLSPSPAPSPVEDNGVPSKHKNSPSPSPDPDVAADVGHAGQTNVGDLKSNDDSGGKNGGQKAGIAIGVIAAACTVGVGAMLYKKRQQNIRRSQYSYAARREIL